MVFPILLERLPNAQLAVPSEALCWNSSLIMRGVKSLLIRF
ncbi:MAG: hypothetical protein ACRCYY_05245 [Trueperaceae bacterium]